MGGAERQLALLAKRLAQLGHQVCVITLYSGGDLEQTLRESGVRVVSAEKRGRWDVLGFLRRFRERCRQSRPQVIIGWMPFENLMCLLVSKLDERVPVVWALRSSALELSAYDVPTQLLYRLQRALIAYPQLVISNSLAGIHGVGLAIGSNRVALLENAVATEEFIPDSDAREAMRASLGVKSDQELIGIVGRLDPMKDHSTFLRAARIVANTLPNAKFLIVGRGSPHYLSNLRSECHRLDLDGRIVWREASSNMRATFNAMDVLVSTSAYGEGMQNVVLEAMSCGLPVVATDVGDARRVISDFDCLVAPRDERAVAQAVLRLLRESDGTRRTARRQHVINRFGIERAGKELEQLLAPLLTHGSDRMFATGRSGE
jgi:glycosyltransferase involved in cell wall biosynthesis